MVVLTVPIFLPIVLTLGFSPIWFGVIIVLVSALGYITPPVGMSCFIIGNMFRDVTLTDILLTKV
jgi:TRAP-type C4-dicarboxylate transport system permease large subunit